LFAAKWPQNWLAGLFFRVKRRCLHLAPEDFFKTPKPHAETKDVPFFGRALCLKARFWGPQEAVPGPEHASKAVSKAVRPETGHGALTLFLFTLRPAEAHSHVPPSIRHL